MAYTTGVKKQLSLFVEIRVAPENVPAFLEALRPCWAGCAGEPECIFFDVFQDPQQPGLFRFVEVWTRDKKWFETVLLQTPGMILRADFPLQKQLTKSYYHPYLEITKPMWLADRQMHYLEREPGFSVWGEQYLAAGKRMEK